MNLLWVSVIFVLVKVSLIRKPLFSVQKPRKCTFSTYQELDSTKLELAIPVKSKSEDIWGVRNYADYAHDDSVKKDGRPTEEFKVACPAKSNVAVEREFEREWKKNNQMPEYTSLFILTEYRDPETLCNFSLTPSIEKVATKNNVGEVQYCGESKAEIYNVGFWVSIKDGTDIQFQFVPVYKMCHTSDEGKGTLYTVHRIESPALLLKEVWEYYEPPSELFQCVLDNSDTEKLSEKKQYAYQIVGSQDMPLKNWATTTRFAFNYTPITLNKKLMKDMIAVDNYIRLFSKKTNKPLTLYSGVYQELVKKPLLHLYRSPTPVDSFWRIIMDDNGLSIIIVIQHTAKKCSEDTFICDKNRDILAEYGLYGGDGCIYTCSVNSEVIKRLRLPQNEIIQLLKLPEIQQKGDLDLRFTRELQNYSEFPEGKNKSVQKLPEKVSIIEFLGKGSFESALNNKSRGGGSEGGGDGGGGGGGGGGD